MELINNEAVAALPAITKFYRVNGATNLYIHVYPKKNGIVSKKFYFRYRRNKKLNNISLGVFPKVSLDVAKEQAKAYNEKLEVGEDIQPPKRVRAPLEPKQYKLKDVFILWFKVFAKDNKRFTRGLDLHVIKRFGNKNIGDLSKRDALSVYDRLFAEGKRETLWRVHSKLASLLKYAISRDYITQSEILNINITTLYGKAESTPYKAITDTSRFRDLLLAIDDYRGSIFVKTALQISPYLFLRSANIRNLEWKEVDFDKKMIVIPASKMKEKEEFLVPLTDRVIEYLRSIQPYSQHLKYVFPSDIASGKALSENALNQGIKRLGFGDEMVYHGLRSSASTFLYENKKYHGQDSEVIELCLDHRERNKVKAVYNRSRRLDDRIELMQWWSDWLDELKR